MVAVLTYLFFSINKKLSTVGCIICEKKNIWANFTFKTILTQS